MNTKTIENYKAEIIQAETDFAKMAASQGVAKAFLHYAAEDAVLSRNNKVVEGKTAIRAYFEKQTLSEVKLEWSPDFVDVAKSGDLAYTYGKYQFSALSAEGDKIESSGIFHTVWKRQADGKWKFVWD